MANPVKILVTVARSPDKRANLRDQLAAALGTLDGVDLAFASGEPEIVAALPGREVMIGVTVTPAMLAAGTSLAWVQLISAGVEHALSPEVLASPVVLTNARGMHVTHMSEHVLAYLLAFGRGLPDCIRWQAKHEWHQRELIERVFTLSGRTAGIVGLGAIGSGCAERMSALGMRVVGVRRRNDRPVPRGVDSAYGPEGLEQVLAQSDVLVIATPHTAATRGMIGAAELAKLKRGAYLVNIARGQVVDEPAMLAALSSGQLAGAGLDVFDVEPLPATSPLWDRPDVIITPHSADTPAMTAPLLETRISENVRAFLGDGRFVGVVDTRAGY